jgi:hypothetical protein
MFTFQSSLGSFLYVYLAQVANETVVGLAISFGWFTCFIISLIVPPMLKTIGIYGTFSFFALFAFVGAVFFQILMKPTEGLSKEKLKVLFYPENYSLTKSIISDM